MRGLTNEERAALTQTIGSGGAMLSTLTVLQQRGLVTLFRQAGELGYGVAPLGKLAVRLDAAARAASGVAC